VPIKPCQRNLDSIHANVVSENEGRERLEIRQLPAPDDDFSGKAVKQHEDLYRRGLTWRDAVFVSEFDSRLTPPGGLLNALQTELIVAIHSIGARKAWQGQSLKAILDGLSLMNHAITEQIDAGLEMPPLLNPTELIREAPWGCLLTKGPEQPAIGRWFPGGGLIYSENGRLWKALTPLRQ
jgi:hypothetical protein